MADNYLEKRMEDLRSGRLSRHGAASSSPRRDSLQWRYPPRRVLLIGNDTEKMTAATAAFVGAECRVAVATDCHDLGKKLRAAHGVRLYDFSDADSGLLIDVCVDDLFKAWRDVDIVVEINDCGDSESGDMTARIASGAAISIAARRSSLPLISDYGGRWIAVVRADVPAPRLFAPLADVGFTISTIRCGDFAPTVATLFGRTLLYLTLPDSRLLDSSEIRIG
ncbi:MAG: hypothetical protein K2G75_03425 [Muribaculaceae bacterium]|nr:hypothetical protein [Muribaculaceae bacterium]MDE5924353.1 hypothetical protein [Muribaculaceae bacterium]